MSFKWSCYIFLKFFLVACVFLFIAGCQSLGYSKSPEVDIYTFQSGDESPSPTPYSEQSQDFKTSTEKAQQDYIERQIVVDEHNKVFSIGVPANTMEKTEVVAEKPIDFWFEYVPDDLKLEVDGVVVQRSSNWEFKIRYTADVTKFEYIATNSTSNYYSYNLHLIPTKAGDSVNVTVRQKWSGL